LRHDRAARKPAAADADDDVSVPPHRRAARRAADDDPDRRGLEGARRRGLRRAHPRLAEDAAEEERAGRLRDAVGTRRARQPHRHRAGRADRDDDLHAQRPRQGGGLLRRLRPHRARALADPQPARAQPLLPGAPARRQRRGAARPFGRARSVDDPVGPRERGAPARPAARSGRRCAGRLVSCAHRPRLAREPRGSRRRLSGLGSGRVNAAACQQAIEGVGAGVAASLRAVDCAAGATAQAAFGRLFGSDGALLPALTILLTLYVAFFAFALITGRSRIGVAALTPRMITVGLVLTFATSWIAYQSVVWNLAVGAPDQIAGILMGTRGSATTLFADKIDVVFAALIEAGGSQGGESATTAFSPPGLMWLGAMLLLLGTVGLLATCKIALAILLTLGPIFVVLALFPSTRGLFTGWLKGVVMLAITPLFAVLGGTLMLELAVPVLRSLVQVPGMIDARAAMAF